ncbi:MAG: response regulator, partial [Nitrospinaceae bacterium]
MTTQIAEPAAEPEKETKSRHKVLIVDGEEKFLEAAVKVFHAVGLETTVSQDPHKALDVLRSEGPFSVVLANSKMDEMEGPEFLCKVKKLHPVTVRILTTASLDGQEVEELVNQGEAYRFLKRPLDYKLLVKSVQESLRKHDENLAQISNAKAVESLKKKYIAAQAEILKLQGRVKKWRLWVALVVMSVFLCGLTFGGIQWLSQRLEKKELK